MSYHRDPTTVRDGIEVLDQDVLTLGNTPWFAKRVIVQLDELVVVHQSTSCRTRSHSRVTGGVMAFVAVGPQAKGTIDGLELSPDLLLVAEPGTEAELVVEAGYESIACMIRPGVLTGHLRQRGRLHEFEMPRGAELRRPIKPECRTLFQLGKALTDTAQQEPSLFEASRQRRSAAQIELLETMLQMVATEEPPEVPGRDRTRQDYCRIVKQAEAYVMENKDTRHYVSDLCKATYTSERTLQYAFRAIMAMTPIAYLRRLRLHRARMELRLAAPDCTTVTAVALDWGFSHFGEFARDYRVCFNELPSETLRRGAVPPSPPAADRA